MNNQRIQFRHYQPSEPINEAAENIEFTTIRFNDLTQKGKHKLAMHVKESKAIWSVHRDLYINEIIEALTRTNPVIMSSNKYRTAFSQINSWTTLMLARCVYYMTIGQGRRNAPNYIEHAVRPWLTEYSAQMLKDIQEGIAYWDENETCTKEPQNCNPNWTDRPHVHITNGGWAMRSWRFDRGVDDSLIFEINTNLRERSKVLELISKFS